MKQRFVLVSLAMFAALSVSAQVQSKHFSPHAKWVMHLDLKALNQSPMGGFIRQSMDDNARRGMAALQAMSGINLTNDIDSLVVYGEGNVATGGVVHAYGRFDVAKLTAVAGGAKEFQNKAFGERSLLSWTDKGKRTCLCFVDPTLVILSQEERMVVEAVARVDGKGPGVGGGEPFARVLSHEKGRFVAVQANDVSAIGGGNAQLQMFKQAEALLLEVGQLSQGNGLECSLVIKAQSAEMAQQFSQAAQGLQALFTLQAAQNPEAAALAQGVKVGMQGDVVTVSLKLPEESLRKMIEVRVEQQKAAADARREARRARQGAEKPPDAEDDAGDAGEQKPARPAF